MAARKYGNKCIPNEFADYSHGMNSLKPDTWSNLIKNLEFTWQMCQRITKGSLS